MTTRYSPLKDRTVTRVASSPHHGSIPGLLFAAGQVGTKYCRWKEGKFVLLLDLVGLCTVGSVGVWREGLRRAEGELIFDLYSFGVVGGLLVSVAVVSLLERLVLDLSRLAILAVVCFLHLLGHPLLTALAYLRSAIWGTLNTGDLAIVLGLHTLVELLSSRYQYGGSGIERRVPTQ